MAVDIQNDVKKDLVRIYNTIKNNPDLFVDGNIHVHVGSVLNKFFGGINDAPVGEKLGKSTGKYQTFKPTKSDFEKKPLPPPPVAEVNPLNELTLPELKVRAKEMGVKYSNKTKEELIIDIMWHEKQNPVRKASAKDLAAAKNASKERTKLVEDDDADFSDDETDLNIGKKKMLPKKEVVINTNENLSESKSDIVIDSGDEFNAADQKHEAQMEDLEPSEKIPGTDDDGIVVANTQ